MILIKGTQEGGYSDAPQPRSGRLPCHPGGVEVSKQNRDRPGAFAHCPCLLALPRFFGLSQLQDWGRSSGSMPHPRAASRPYVSPHLGSLERLGAESQSHSSPRPRPQVPRLELLAGVTRGGCTMHTRACASVGVYVYIFCWSLGNMGLGSKAANERWDVKVSITQQ